MAQEERRKIEWAKTVVELTIIIVTNIVLVVGAYYKLDARMAMAEQQISQETKGYESLLKSFNDRMDLHEKKLDCLATPKFCH